MLTNKLSQDHLELFFGAGRAKGGFNNNPTARQFEAAYKRLLVYTQINYISPNTGNVTISDTLNILSCGSGPQLTINDNDDDLLESKTYLDFEAKIKENLELNDYSSAAWNLTMYTEDVVAYISGFVVRALKKCVTCAQCLALLETDEVLSSLQKRKQFGNLIMRFRVDCQNM